MAILFEGVPALRTVITDDSPQAGPRISCTPGIEIAWGDADHVPIKRDGVRARGADRRTGEKRAGKEGGPTTHQAIAPTRYRQTPATQHAASVGIMPTLNLKMAIAAATESSSAQTSTLARFGASNDSGNARTATV